jgi:S1-C subfamily serine protease
MIAGLLRRRLVGPEQVWGSHPRPARREELAGRYGINVVESNREAAVAARTEAGASVVVVAVKPQRVGKVLSELRGALGAGQLLVSIVAGARMETLTPGLAEAIGVERGVLVIAVAPGVPAHESGLLDGDVILRANGRDIDSVGDLSLALAKSDDKSVRLDVARKGKVRQVTLRW